MNLNKLSLNECARLAREQGVTYGKFAAAGMFERTVSETAAVNASDGRTVSAPVPVAGAKECGWCGNLFVPHYASVKYCSVKCRRAAASKMTVEKHSARWQMNECAVCGGSFLAHGKGTKYCGPECRSKGKSELLKAQVAERARLRNEADKTD